MDERTFEDIRRHTSGVILAGGLGQRMGSVDKGLQPFRGRPLAAWAVEQLAPQVDELMISANRNEADYALLVGAHGYAIINDRIPGFVGPMAGLHAALAHSRHPFVATVPCDSPFLPQDLVERLGKSLQQAQSMIAVARCDGRTHPVFCLCRKMLLSSLERSLINQELHFKHWIRTQNFIEVDFDDQPQAFVNINTLDELQRMSAD